MNTQSLNEQAGKQPSSNEIQNQAEANASQQRGKKKYHKSAMYASTLIRGSVGHVKPHSHSGIDI